MKHFDPAARVGAVMTALTTLFSFPALACHESWPTWRKVADPAGYLFCAEVFAHFDSSGTGSDENLSSDKKALATDHANCHLDCRPPGDGFLMGHYHGTKMAGEPPRQVCDPGRTLVCQLKQLPGQPSDETDVPVKKIPNIPTLKLP